LAKSSYIQGLKKKLYTSKYVLTFKDDLKFLISRKITYNNKFKDTKFASEERLNVFFFKSFI